MTDEAKSVWWLSYASDEGEANGVVVVEASNFLLACAESRRLGLSPGGTVRGFEVPVDATVYGSVYRNRYYAPSEARELAKLD